MNEQLEERHYEFRSNCNDGEGECIRMARPPLASLRSNCPALVCLQRTPGDASACHSWGEWLAVVDKNYTQAGTGVVEWVTCSKMVAGLADFRGGGVLSSDHVPHELREERLPGVLLQPRPSDAYEIRLIIHRHDQLLIGASHRLQLLARESRRTTKRRSTCLVRLRQCDPLHVYTRG